MTPILFFLTLLTSNRDVMGEHANSLRQKVRAWVCVGILMAVSAFAAALAIV
jgi:Mn2+/Fe2+ NRAMP family transporter